MKHRKYQNFWMNNKVRGDKYAICLHFLTHLLKVGCVAQLAERRSLAGELTLSCARPAADG